MIKTPKTFDVTRLWLIAVFMIPLMISAQDSSSEFKLEGQSFDGKIRAKGILGLFAVQGTLSFNDGNLIWSARDDDDELPYKEEMVNGVLKFMAETEIENEDNVKWTGFYRNGQIYDVTAEWTRIPGDFVHDLLLPDVVILKFTPID